jgi:hypothetical protein
MEEDTPVKVADVRFNATIDKPDTELPPSPCEPAPSSPRCCDEITFDPLQALLPSILGAVAVAWVVGFVSGGLIFSPSRVDSL